MSFLTLVFYLVSALMIFTAARVVSAERVFRAALYLAATLALVAVQYLLLRAEFVAVVQLLVYVGAVIILVIFAVMLTAQLGDERVGQTNRLALPAALGCGLLFYGLGKALTGTDWGKVTPAPAQAAIQGASGNLQAVGLSLLADYVYPFELVGLILFTALVGAVLIARKDPDAGLSASALSPRTEPMEGLPKGNVAGPPASALSPRIEPMEGLPKGNVAGSSASAPEEKP